jgi:DNA-binding transcriptional LysR family regulator
MYSGGSIKQFQCFAISIPKRRTMDKFDSMRLLVRVVERQSFSAAASDLGIPRSTATTAIKQFEESLGVRLLQRTTRQVTPTLEGEIYYQRCKTILAEIDDAEAALTGTQVRGLLRLNVHAPLARTFVLPKLPGFMERHPALSLFIGEGDRFVDIVREGYDCVIRGGEIADSDMIVRRLGLAREATFASPAYLERRDAPHYRTATRSRDDRFRLLAPRPTSATRSHGSWRGAQCDLAAPRHRNRHRKPTPLWPALVSVSCKCLAIARSKTSQQACLLK